MENPIKMDDLGVPLFLDTPIFWSYTYAPSVVYVWCENGWLQCKPFLLGHGIFLDVFAVKFGEGSISMDHLKAKKWSWYPYKVGPH